MTTDGYLLDGGSINKLRTLFQNDPQTLSSRPWAGNVDLSKSPVWLGYAVDTIDTIPDDGNEEDATGSKRGNSGEFRIVRFDRASGSEIDETEDPVTVIAHDYLQTGINANERAILFYARNEHKDNDDGDSAFADSFDDDFGNEQNYGWYFVRKPVSGWGADYLNSGPFWSDYDAVADGDYGHIIHPGTTVGDGVCIRSGADSPNSLEVLQDGQYLVTLSFTIKLQENLDPSDDSDLDFTNMDVLAGASIPSYRVPTLGDESTWADPVAWGFANDVLAAISDINYNYWTELLAKVGSLQSAANTKLQAITDYINANCRPTRVNASAAIHIKGQAADEPTDSALDWWHDFTIVSNIPSQNTPADDFIVSVCLNNIFELQSGWFVKGSVSCPEDFSIRGYALTVERVG